MLDNAYFKNGHLTALSFLMLDSGELSDREKELILYHLSNCNECMMKYVDSLTEDTLIDPPSGLEQKILNKISSQRTNKKHGNSIAIQFVKLAIAISITMVLFVSGVFELIESFPTEMIKNNREKQIEQSQSTKITDDISNSFNQFAQKFNNFYKGEKKHERK